MHATAQSDSRHLLGLAALSDFLVRSHQCGPAVSTTDRLADALLAYERGLGPHDRTAAAPLRREALRLRAEVTLLNRRLRRGPVRHPPTFHHRIEALVLRTVDN
jgi:hypothetical protein